MRLEAERCGGQMEVRGVREARLDTAGGRIEAQDVVGALEVHTGGDLQVEACPGPIKLETGGGNITVRQAQAAESSAKATTGAGNVQVGVAQAGSAAQVELETGGGDIELRLPQGACPRAKASTHHDWVKIERLSGTQYTRSPGHLESLLGDRRGLVRPRTGTGDIPIHLTATLSWWKEGGAVRAFSGLTSTTPILDAMQFGVNPRAARIVAAHVR
jgi:hypothetical protein